MPALLLALLLLSVAAGGSTTKAPTAKATKGDCTFEKGMCGWVQSGAKKWTRGSQTPSDQDRQHRPLQSSIGLFVRVFGGVWGKQRNDKRPGAQR